MSIEMQLIPFVRLMEQALCSYRKEKTLFAVPAVPVSEFENKVSLFGTQLETPIGPAAGPHTQLAQNLIAGYGAGARFFELKTVQILWGEQLGIQRPCILVKDEAYNTEWSTELSPEQAAGEYIKAWIAIKLLAKEFGLGDPDGFLFNISVGYDLAGIQSESVNTFIDTMKDASQSRVWLDCITEAKALPLANVDAAYIDSISPRISNNVTLSTMHGCPPEQIQKIAAYLLTEKHLNTYVKCNPTLVGYDTARKLLDDLGYTDIVFGKEHFEHDMQRSDAISMLKHLLAVADGEGLRFGVKLTNTFPVQIAQQELPGDAMYLSGKALYPLSIHTAELLETAFDGTLPISFSGGADTETIDGLLRAGFYPITVATLLLKAGGYRNLTKLAKCAAELHLDWERVDTEQVKLLAERSAHDRHLIRRTRKTMPKQIPPFACGRCTTCVDVCPNRANYHVPGLDKKVIHLDGPCNDCGNCASVCPFGFTPYDDKFVLYPSAAILRESSRDGFAITDSGYLVRWQGALVSDLTALPAQVIDLMDAVAKMNL